MLPENKFDAKTKRQLTAADFNVLFNAPLSEFMQKRLFDPLGMKDTTFWPNASQVARLAKRLRRD